ncbi:MAG: membrane dipeptidase [bacterium]|nr:membrane dipeptidase [bacterium]
MGGVWRMVWLAPFLLAMAATAKGEAAEDRCQVPGLDPGLVSEARRLLDQVPLIDGHNDLPSVLREDFKNRLAQVDLRSDLRQLEGPTQTDIPRLRQGGVGGQFWSAFVATDLPPGEAVRAVIEQVDLVHRLSERYPDVFEVALTAADVRRIHAAGRIASLVGIEGGHSIGNSLAVLRQLFALGARYMTLTHWPNTDWADSATVAPEHGGLTDFGREVILEMNRLGMLVDLSHVSWETMHDVLEVTEAPVIFSHSGAAAVTSHPRNVPDSVLERLKENGGVVMVPFVQSFVSQELRSHRVARAGERERLRALHLGDPQAAGEALAAWDDAHPRPSATLQQVADHLDHVRRTVGVAYVGIGSDFDGMGHGPRGLEDVSCFPALLGELLRRGYSREEVKLVAGGNLLRVMHHAEEVAARVRGQRFASEALIDDVDRPPSEAGSGGEGR